MDDSSGDFQEETIAFSPEVTKKAAAAERRRLNELNPTPLSSRPGVLDHPWQYTTAYNKNHKPHTYSDTIAKTVQESWHSRPPERFIRDIDRSLMRPLDWKEIAQIMGFPLSYFGEYAVKAQIGSYEQRRKAQRDVISQLGNSIALPMAHGIISALIDTKNEFGGLKNKTFLEICCGIGALSDGARLNNLEVLDGVDVDHHKNGCLVVYEHNFGVATKMSVNDYDFKRYRGKLGLIAGGPPCQPWSSGGLKRGVNDEREICLSLPQYVKECNPELFLFEEAPTFLTSKKNHEFVQSLIKQFSKLGYYTEAWLIDVASFDVPSTRQRTIFFGLKKERYDTSKISIALAKNLAKHSSTLKKTLSDVLINENELTEYEGTFQGKPSSSKWYDWPWPEDDKKKTIKRSRKRGSMSKKFGGFKSRQ
jgi:site-specific DNA-cytosine methylase